MSLFSRFDRHPDELISASLTGDLSAAERRELEVHLSGCDECRQTLESFRVQRDLLSGLHQVPAPRDLGARVSAGVASGNGRSWWRRPGGILAVGGTLATVAAAALLAKTPHPTNDDIDTNMTNICRCGTYQRIRRAIHRAAMMPQGGAR